jgi:hypothetical protein
MGIRTQLQPLSDSKIPNGKMNGGKTIGTISLFDH